MTKSKDFIVLQEYIKQHQVNLVNESRYLPKGKYGVCMLANEGNLKSNPRKAWVCSNDCRVYDACDKNISSELAPSLSKEELDVLLKDHPEYFI